MRRGSKVPRRAHSTRAAGRRAELRALAHYLLRGYKLVGRNVWAGGYEVDLIVRRGRRLVFCEVKSKRGTLLGDPLEMVGPEKLERVTRAAEAWLAVNPELAGLDIAVEVVAVRGRTVERVAVTA
jgi:putative endonuclease